MAPFSNWHHAPPHHDLGAGYPYIITAGTLDKIPMFASATRLDVVCDTLHEVCREEGWRLEAWAVLSNHYHIVATAAEGALPINRLISKTHHLSAKRLNLIDGTPKRRVWNQYWETPLTFRRSYLARLRYVHFNPSRHGVCKDASSYRWCSAATFLNSAEPGFIKTVLAMPIDTVIVPDDF